MKKIEAYRANNGQLEIDPIRAIAHDIADAFDKRAKRAAVGTSSVGSSKIDWHAAMELLSGMDMLMPHLKAYQDILHPPAKDIVDRP